MTETPTVGEEFTDALAFACPEPGCARVFDSAQAIQGHSMVHRTPSPCPECGKRYATPGALGNHRKNDHGIEGSSWASKSAKTKRATTNPNPLGRPKRRKTEEFRADDIVNAAIALLWPSGMLPVRAMTPLIQWRDATVEFLEKINSE